MLVIILSRFILFHIKYLKCKEINIKENPFYHQTLWYWWKKANVHNSPLSRHFKIYLILICIRCLFQLMIILQYICALYAVNKTMIKRFKSFNLISTEIDIKNTFWRCFVLWSRFKISVRCCGINMSINIALVWIIYIIL